MANKKPLPPDSLVDYSEEGVPVSRKSQQEVPPGTVTSIQNTTENQENDQDSLRRSKKRQGTEEAQKRSDTGTGL